MIDLRILSLGAGVQSTALYLMALDGEIGPMPDVAIFADTQQEPPWVYENVWRLAEEGGARLPIHVATVGDIGEAVASPGFVAVPFWVAGANGKPSPARRQCTREYKIDAVQRHARKLLGLAPGQHATRYHVEQWIGISLDEAHRAKPSRIKWMHSRWPLLLDKPMRRYEAQAYIERRGWPVVQKSSCVFCPYRSPVEYAHLRMDAPAVFDAACEWDDRLRTNKGRRGQYVSKLLTPLRDLPPLEDLEKRPDAQLDLFGNECEGMCGV